MAKEPDESYQWRQYLIQVPVGAIHDRGSGPGVWTVDDKSEVKFRAVTIASIGQEQVVLSS